MAAQRKKFPLLLYRRYHQTNSGLSKFIIALGLLALSGVVALRIFGPGENPATFSLALKLCLALLFLGVARFLFTFLVSRTAYVECRPRALKIRTPFLPLVISYRRIRNTRPVTLRDVFPPEKQKRNRKLLEAHWGETVVVIEMSRLPMSPGLLRAIMGPYFFHPDGSGLVLLVDDWMGFSQALDQALTDYRLQRTAP